MTSSSLPPPSFPPAPPDPDDDLVTVITCASEFEAETQAAVLRDAGIEAFAFGSVHRSLPMSTKFLRVPVQVRAAELDRAKAVLQQNRAEAREIDWDSVDVGEREDNLPLHKPGRRPLLAWIGLILGILAALLMLERFTAMVLWPLGGG